MEQLPGTDRALLGNSLSRDRSFSGFIIIAVLLVLSACGGDADSGTSRSGKGTPNTSLAEEFSTARVEQAEATMEGAGTPSLSSVATVQSGQPNETSTIEEETAPIGTGDASLPEGAIVGTPRPDDPLDKAPVEGPAEASTSRPSSYDGDGDGFLEPPEVIQAVTVIYPEYVWPEDYRLDLEALIIGIEEEAEKYPIKFENGYERNLLVFPNLCAWSYSLLDAMFSGDEQLVSESIEQLRQTLAVHPEKATLQEVVGDAINRAELGDPAPLQVQIDAMGCAGMTWDPQTEDSAMPSGIKDGSAANAFTAIRRDVVFA